MIVDLRDYTLVPGTRDRLLERCEALFYPEQERLGATILGAFADADDERRLVWIRATPDLDTRKRVLTAFYADGEMWRQHREEVNSWIVDSDDVLLVRPVGELAAPATGPSVVGMYTHVRREPLPVGEAAALSRQVEEAVRAASGRLLVTLETVDVENNYPRHPIRVGEHGRVWLASFREQRSLGIPAVVERRLIPIPSSRLR